jgi:TetR/AcrR family transcriptional regulator, repressor for uid operon
MTHGVKPSLRELRRLQTRKRVLGAAITEFKRAGIASADVDAIASSAGVAHGTFFFHFPTKDHVQLELECRDEGRFATEFARFLDEPHDLPTALAEVVRLVAALEQRLGGLLFKDVLALHFSPSRPKRDEEWTDHPVIALLVREIERARDDGEAHPLSRCLLQCGLLPARHLRSAEHGRQHRRARHDARQVDCHGCTQLGAPMTPKLFVRTQSTDQEV